MDENTGVDGFVCIYSLCVFCGPTLNYSNSQTPNEGLDFFIHVPSTTVFGQFRLKSTILQVLQVVLLCNGYFNLIDQVQYKKECHTFRKN